MANSHIPLPAGGSINLVNVTADGTYTPPSNLIAAWVACIPGGSGGGSGRRGATTTTRVGGQGGAGGALVRRFMLVAEMGGPVTVTIGAGGAGGASAAADNTNGNPGTKGGNTSFGAFIVAAAGDPGLGGDAFGLAVQDGGLTTACTPAQAPMSFQGNPSISAGVSSPAASTAGRNGFAETPSEPLATFYTSSGLGSAGSGGGITNGNVVRAGHAAGGMYVYGSLTAGVAGGAASGNGNAGTANLKDDLFDFNPATGLVPTSTIGLPGSGGGAGNTGGGNGGNGGLYGGAGGGGGATLNGFNSGAGGNGRDGLCVILEILS